MIVLRFFVYNIELEHEWFEFVPTHTNNKTHPLSMTLPSSVLQCLFLSFQGHSVVAFILTFGLETKFRAMEDYYQVLGVPRNASHDDLKKA